MYLIGGEFVCLVGIDNISRPFICIHARHTIPTLSPLSVGAIFRRITSLSEIMDPL